MLSLENAGVYLTCGVNVDDEPDASCGCWKHRNIFTSPSDNLRKVVHWTIRELALDCMVVVAPASKNQEGELDFFRSVLLGMESNWLSLTSEGGGF